MYNQKVHIKLKRFDKTLPLPTYKSPGAVGIDLYSRTSVTIAAHSVGYIPLNIAIEIPPNYWVMIASRGSTHKMGILMANGFAIGDPDFCGDNDEYAFPALNFTDHEVTIEKGLRIAQMMIFKYEKIEIEEVDKLTQPNRGKFGSTGKY